jgi:mRNA interferase RelE/StbE
VASYLVSVKSSVQKDLDALSDVLFARIDRKIMMLAVDPRPPGCKKLQGCKDLWRIRVGDYRVIYSIKDSSLTVDVTQVAHRKDVYD